MLPFILELEIILVTGGRWVGGSGADTSLAFDFRDAADAGASSPEVIDGEGARLLPVV